MFVLYDTEVQAGKLFDRRIRYILCSIWHNQKIDKSYICNNSTVHYVGIYCVSVEVGFYLTTFVSSAL